jgi:hypothetical protein
LFARYGWEIVEKLIERDTGLEVAVEGLDRYARPAKDRGSADELRINRNGKTIQVFLINYERHVHLD